MIQLILNECDFFQIKYGTYDLLFYSHPLRKTYFENPVEYLLPYAKAYIVFEINYN